MGLQEAPLRAAALKLLCELCVMTDRTLMDHSGVPTPRVPPSAASPSPYAGRVNTMALLTAAEQQGGVSSAKGQQAGGGSVGALTSERMKKFLEALFVCTLVGLTA